MIAKVLIDNIAEEALIGEWGLAVYIEHEGNKILLDTGTTGDFVKNARAIGVELKDVDYAVLSHAHYDHADGMAAFFAENKKAKFYLRDEAEENCYKKAFPFPKYIGIKKGTLREYADRVEKVSGDFELCPNVYLIPHKTPGLEERGKAAKMIVKKGFFFQTDSFAHEQSLVLRTENGLVIFNSCSHGGADNILEEIKKTFPNEKIYGIIGGFHLFRSTKEQVYHMAEGIKKSGIEHVITGHCTGQQAYEWLKEVLGERVQQIKTGLVIEV